MFERASPRAVRVLAQAADQGRRIACAQQVREALDFGLDQLAGFASGLPAALEVVVHD
jgi:hypothetical protein